MVKVEWRVASDKDLDLVVSLESHLFKREDRFSPRRLLDLIRGENAYVLLCWQAGACVGYGIALRTKLRNGRYKGRIYSLGVVRQKRRTGIGARILVALEAWLIKHGASFITLETRFGKNVLFYEKRGYRPVERLPRYYAGATGLRMRKDPPLLTTALSRQLSSLSGRQA
jgi:ribosomal protein S18 acetylase RimI-like enzyme